MNLQAWLDRHPRLSLAGDACLVSAAAFGAVIGTEFLLIGHAEPSAWIAIPASVLTLASVLVGPALAWLLRGRRLTWWGVLGALVASVAVILGTQALVFAAMGLAWLLTPITSAELAGPIALLALASLGFLAICSLPARAEFAALRARGSVDSLPTGGAACQEIRARPSRYSGGSGSSPQRLMPSSMRIAVPRRRAGT